jgi:hypothetical protein
MAAWPRRTRGKDLRLSCWNAEGFLERKLQLEQSLSEHGLDICLLNETDLGGGGSPKFPELCMPPDGSTEPLLV